jgi:hypothetical protein
MQLFAWDTGTMIAAAVQGDVDGISKRSHDSIVRRVTWSHYPLFNGPHHARSNDGGNVDAFGCDARGFNRKRLQRRITGSDPRTLKRSCTRMLVW